MICPNCGHDNVGQAIRCGGCGEYLPIPRPQPTPPPAPAAYCSLPGYVILASVALLAAPVIGIFYHLIARAADLFILLAALAGLALGYVLAASVTITRCRNLAFVTALAVVAASTAYGTKICLDGSYFVANQLPKMLAAELHIPKEQARRAARRIAAQLGPLGSTHFYLDLQAQTGIIVGRNPERGGVGVGGPLLWTLIAFEMGVAALIASRKAVRAATAPFCEACGEWSAEAVMFRMGSERFEQVLQATVNQAWEDLAKLPPAGRVSKRDCCEVVIITCPQCESRGMVLRAIEGGRARELWHADLSPESADGLYRARQLHLAQRTGVGTSA